MAKKLKKRKYTRRAVKAVRETVAANPPVRINVNLSKNSVDERAAIALKDVAESIRQNAATLQTVAEAALNNAQASRDYLKYFNSNSRNEAGNVDEANEQFSNVLKQAS